MSESLSLAFDLRFEDLYRRDGLVRLDKIDQRMPPRLDRKFFGKQSMWHEVRSLPEMRDRRRLFVNKGVQARRWSPISWT